MANNPKKKRQADDDEHLPPDGSQKPISLQRRRVWRACESCRRKKIKCDGVEPVCAQCAASSSQCTWLQTKDRAALSRHYVQELEARLMHMESLFGQIAPVLEQMGHSPASLGLPTDGATGFAPPAISATVPTTLNGDHAVRPSASEPAVKIEDADDMSESFGNLALDEHGHMRWIGGSSTMSLIQWFKNQTTAPMARVSPMEDDPRAPGPSVNKLYFPAAVLFGKVRALPGPEEVEYPERDLADKLIDAYFTRLHYLLPVLDKPSFILKYRYLMDNTRDIALHQTETSFISLVFAVFACAARLVDDPRLSTGEHEESGDGGMAMVFYERAQILHYIGHKTIQVTHVQCFILMASYLCSVNCLPQAWILVGQAVRTAQDLGLHRSPRRLICPPIEKETRRKIWWSVYTLDRMLAVALGRPLGIEDRDCDVELPVDVDDEQLPEYYTGATLSRERPPLMAGFLALITLYKIAGRVLRQVYALENCRDNLEPERRLELQRMVEILDKDLTKWCDELPAVFKSSPVTERDVSMGAVLCSHYYSILTTLHRNFLPVKREQPVAPRSVAKAVSSARACIRLAPSIKNVVPISHHLSFFIQHLFSSAVIILLYAMHTPDVKGAHAAMEEARSCLGALESWEGHWPGARKCRELLTDLTQTAAEAIKAGGFAHANGASVAAAAAVPLPASPPLGPVPERRLSISIAPGMHPTSSSKGGAVRNRRQGRDRSIDPYTQQKRASATSPYRVDNSSGLRARSLSRRRGRDDDAVPPSPSTASYATQYPGAPYQPATSSPHSSPGSMRGLPSPTVIMEPLPPLPSGVLNGASPTFGMAPMHVPSPPRFDFNAFGMTPPARPSSRSPNLANASVMSADGWGSQARAADGMGFYGADPNLAGSSSGLFGAQAGMGMDGGFAGYDASAQWASVPDASTGLGFPTTPPYGSFATPGLPFRGLDFIRDLGSTDGYDIGASQQESWPVVDGFRQDPDLAFNLLDFTTEPGHGHISAAGHSGHL